MAETYLSAQHPGFVHYEVTSITRHESWASKRPVAPSMVATALDLLLQPLGFSVDDIRWRPDDCKPHDGKREALRGRQAQDFVYFLLAGPFVKIGKTSGRPDSRIKELQTGCPFPIQLVGHVRGGMSKERELHRSFADYRAHGEWFRHEGALAEFIRTIKGESE